MGSPGLGRKLPVLDPIVSASLPVRLLGMKMRNNLEYELVITECGKSPILMAGVTQKYQHPEMEGAELDNPV